jgi:hypothetical protein
MVGRTPTTYSKSAILCEDRYNFYSDDAGTAKTSCTTSPSVFICVLTAIGEMGKLAAVCAFSQLHDALHDLFMRRNQKGAVRSFE